MSQTTQVFQRTRGHLKTQAALSVLSTLEKFIHVLGEYVVKQLGHRNVSYLQCIPFGYWKIKIL